MFFLDDFPAITCGDMEIPGVVGRIVSIIYLAIRIGIPIILLIVGMVDLGKAVVAQKEDEIKKAQSLLIKKVVAAVLVFLLLTLITFAINLVNTDENKDTMWNCIDSLLNYDSNAVADTGDETETSTEG